MWRLFLYPLGGPMRRHPRAARAALGVPRRASPRRRSRGSSFVQIWANMGITMVIFLAGLQTIPDELIEAARIDGASRRQSFRHVTWPLLTPERQHQPHPEHHRLAPGVAAVPGAHRLPAGHPGDGLRRLRPGVRPDVRQHHRQQLPAGLRRGRVGRPVRARVRHRRDRRCACSDDAKRGCSDEPRRSVHDRDRHRRAADAPARRRRPSTGATSCSYAAAASCSASSTSGPMLMLLNTALKTQPEFAKDPVGLTHHVQPRQLRRGLGQGELPALPGQLGALHGRRHGRCTSSPACPCRVAIARRYVRGWNLLYILFVVALFLPAALIPQFQLILQPAPLQHPAGLHPAVPGQPHRRRSSSSSYIRSIPRELDEAAAIDGCGYIRFVVADHRAAHQAGHRDRRDPPRHRHLERAGAAPPSTSRNEAYYPITRGLIVFTGIYGNDWPLLAAAVLMLALPDGGALPVPPALHHRRLHRGLAAWLRCAERRGVVAGPPVPRPAHGRCPRVRRRAVVRPHRGFASGRVRRIPATGHGPRVGG